MDKQYWVRGDDGDDYGPVGKVDVRAWIGEGRVGLDTEIRTGGADGTWKALQHYPELLVLIAEDEVRRQRQDMVEGLHLASIAHRAMAYILDSALIILFGSMLFALLLTTYHGISLEAYTEMMLDWLHNEPTTLPPFSSLSNLSLIMVQTLYFWALIAYRGQTVGMRIFRLRVVDQSGLLVNSWQSFVRAAGLYFSSFYFLGFIVVFFTAKRQTFHDLVAKTYVIRLPGK